MVILGILLYLVVAGVVGYGAWFIVALVLSDSRNSYSGWQQLAMLVGVPTAAGLLWPISLAVAGVYLLILKFTAR